MGSVQCRISAIAQFSFIYSICYIAFVKDILKILVVLFVLAFAGIGVVVTFVFFGMQYEVFNVPGSIIERNASFGLVPTTSKAISEPESNGCKEGLSQTEPCFWFDTVQWEVVKGGLEKDAQIINRVADETGVEARMIASAVIPEQSRFFTDNREVFKRYFEPLKLLVSLSKFSLGVSGIKQETAEVIEEHTLNTASAFYPGDTFSSLITYEDGVDKKQELFNRLTNEKDHYYSYLYTAIYLKEIEAQWLKEGYDVKKRPDVLVTLFNLGFDASKPKENPQVGGARITLGGQAYSFGYLGTLFYESEELSDIFSR